KIGSELDKPDGLTLLTSADIPLRIWPLSVRKVNGIGPKASGKMAGLGIVTVGDLAAADAGLLQMHFGRSYSGWLVEIAQGRDERPVVVSSEPKSMSRETTFERDLHPKGDRPALSAAFTALCVRLAEDLRRKGYVGQTIGLKLRFDDFQTVTRDVTLLAPVGDAASIRHAATECLKRISLTRRLRLLGVRASGLTRADEAHAGERPVQGELSFAPTGLDSDNAGGVD
ncbi:MAG: DNA polymerase IV, partial [Janthinobacterium lividum]